MTDSAPPIDRVAVVGAGTMGYGLAVQCALEGCVVTLTDHREANLDRAAERVGAAVEFLSEAGRTGRRPESVLGTIGGTTDRADAVADAGIVLETVSEDLAVKREVVGDVAAHAPDDAILASNTSGLPVTALAEGVPDAADRVVGCHWWNPPYLLRPVEVVRGEATSDRTVERTRAFVESVDRDPVLVERDVPGFVWNRVQFAVLRECAHLVREGVASVEDVNRAVRDGYARRTAVVGPFETVDLAGLELFATIASDLYPHLADDDGPGTEFAERIDAGKTGVRAGEGFFAYDESEDAVVERRDERLADLAELLDDEEE
ncbi:3-hydroxyacyl-CoA dehydrogenase family protein [Halomarina litorea]|uniref:3-hydroxyacyl-CoA dehydrogenase family protein n=1 Tax=Halomarina litorea TaxID=2961595 RepID=UPI0020C3E700|nr:3-hydroxyacyl-CoA dehydrogenase family protein [Halomarina sp. BCD28]